MTGNALTVEGYGRMIEQLLAFFSWINQCDDLPIECYNATALCTCQSFLAPFFLSALIGVAVFILMIIRVFFGTIREPDKNKKPITFADGVD